MKHLSFILALMVLVLSTAPCFMEDKCLDFTHETANGQEHDDGECQCCSPFSICKTCTGFILISFHSLIGHPIKTSEKKGHAIPAPPISDFPYSLWHPPQLA